MLENSVFSQYNKNRTLLEVIASIYGCEKEDIALDEKELYALIKKHLTKKELRLIFMNEAGIDVDEIVKTLHVEFENYESLKHKAYQKLRSNKIQDSAKNTNISH